MKTCRSDQKSSGHALVDSIAKELFRVVRREIRENAEFDYLDMWGDFDMWMELLTIECEILSYDVYFDVSSKERTLYVYSSERLCENVSSAVLSLMDADVSKCIDEEMSKWSKDIGTERDDEYKYNGVSPSDFY